jgi:HK97 family phage portal protein
VSKFTERDLDALNAIWRPEARARTSPENPRNHETPWFVGRYAGVVVTPEIALQVATVWACIEIIAKSVASQRWKIYEQLPKGDHEELFNDHVGYLLNCRPNPEMSAVSMREALAMAAVAFGNCYAEIEWDRSNRPYAIWPLAPERCELVRTDGRLQLRVANFERPPTYLEYEDVLHVHGIGLTGLVGANIISQATHTIALAIAAERFAEAYFGNGTQVGGGLMYPEKLDDEHYERLKKEWNETHGGPNRAFRPFILDGGATWQQIAADGEKSQMNQSRAAQVTEICRWFGVPPHKVADLTRSTNNNIEHQGLEFVRDALKPWAVRFEQEVDYKLLDTRGRPRFSRIDLDPLSQGDAVSRKDYYVGMRNIGAFSVNDILRMENKNTIGVEGDIRIVNGASTRLEDVGKNIVPAGPGGKKPAQAGDEAGGGHVADTFRQMFVGFFSRIETRRQARRADLSAKLDAAGVSAAMEHFVATQIAYLSDCLRKPCEALAERSVGGDPFAVALTAGRKVAAGESTPAEAAEHVIKTVLGEA